MKKFTLLRIMNCLEVFQDAKRSVFGGWKINQGTHSSHSDIEMVAI